LEEVGIYRLSGSLLQVKELRKMYDLEKDVLFEFIDPNAVASLFKMWIRECKLQSF
jgi:hypothetical protein